MPSDLTPTRLRALIAAATKATLDAFPDDAQFQNLNWSSMNGRFRRKDADLIVYLVNNAPALADALEAKELLEWLTDECVDTIYMDDGRIIDLQSGDVAKALRAAKEAADA